jgi:hypothetical protein
MKYEKLSIETNGTTAGTKVCVDGEQLGLVQRIEFSANLDDVFPVINIEMARQVNGQIKTKKVKVRDNKTQKFVEKEVTETQHLILERKI